MNLQQSAHEHPVAYMVGAVIGSLFVGLICGLIPLATGAALKQARMGVWGFIACIVVGFIGGALFAVPVALGFSIACVVAWRKAGKEASRQAG